MSAIFARLAVPEVIPFGSDALVEILAPTLESTGAAITSATATITAFDDRSDLVLVPRVTYLTAAAAAAATSLEVRSSARFEVNDTVVITLDDGALWSDTIAVIPDSTHLTLTSGIPVSAGKASLVARRVHGASARYYEVADPRPINLLDIVSFDTPGSGGVLTWVVDKGDSWIELAGTLGPRTTGEKLGKRLGVQQSGAAFGATKTPYLDDGSWGYRATIPDTQGFRPGQVVRFEAKLVEGGGPVWLASARSTVVATR